MTRMETTNARDPLLPPTETLDELGAAIRGAGCLVCSHVDPDGDALGSTLGLALGLRHLGIAAVPALAEESDVSAAYDFLPGIGSLVPAAEAQVPDVFIALDVPDLARLGAAADVARSASTLVVIDHHPDSRIDAHIRWVDPGAAAVGQMLWHLLPELGVRPDMDIATCLYVALVTDTGRFQYSNTTPQALRDAADMIEHGLDPASIYLRLYENRSLGLTALTGRVMARIALGNGGAVAYSHLDLHDLETTDTASSDTENMIDAVRAIGGVDVVFLVKQFGDGCRVSLRSKTAFDVGSVARVMGGGGHQAASGFTYDGQMDALLADLLPRLPIRDHRDPS